MYEGGIRNAEVIATSRNAIAKKLRCRASELFFTGGATEANNLAIQGVVKAFRATNPNIRPHLMYSGIEHASVRETMTSLQGPL